MSESERANADALRVVTSKERLSRPNVTDEALSTYLGAAYYYEEQVEVRTAAGAPVPAGYETPAELAPEPGRTTLVVGVDGTEISRYALDWAVRHAAMTGAEVVALAVSMVTPVPASTVPLPVAEDRPPSHDLQERRAELDSAVEAASKIAPMVPIRSVLAMGLAGPTLCAAVDIEKAALLVIGSHGRGALMRALLGSVASYCVQHASCPVIVMPAMLVAGKAEPVASAHGTN